MSSEARFTVYAKRAQLTYGNTTSAKRFTLPPGSYPIAVHCFTAATSSGATLDVGISSNDDYYVAAGDVSTAAVAELSLLIGTKITVPTDVYMHIGGSPSSGGPFDVILLYINEKSRRVL